MMALRVPIGMLFWASAKSPDLLLPAMIPDVEVIQLLVNLVIPKTHVIIQTE